MKRIENDINAYGEFYVMYINREKIAVYRKDTKDKFNGFYVMINLKFL